MPLRYVRRVVKAIIPVKLTEILTVATIVSVILYPSYRLIFRDNEPVAIVHSETQYPRTVPRGGYFFLRFDLTFDRDCNIHARRLIRGSDGVEYLAQKDNRNVIGGERMQYTVRVPVSEAIPLGNALVRSQFSYRCDFWSRYIKPVERGGQARRVLITPTGTMPTSEGTSCILPPRDGYVVVRTHYRKKKPS